jgi:hypothetical protein
LGNGVLICIHPLLGGNDFSTVTEVQMILKDVYDNLGSKWAFVAETAVGPRIFTVGPIYQQGELIGAAMVGVFLAQMLADLTTACRDLMADLPVFTAWKIRVHLSRRVLGWGCLSRDRW